jgi:rhomboid protease GluP
MCPNCRAFITTGDKVCPYCEAPIGPRAIDVREPGEVLGGLIPHAHFTTVLILLINFGIYIATAVYAMNTGRGGGFFDLDVQTLFLFGAKYGPAITHGQWWRLITAGFLHGGLIHIGMNSWVLYDLGAQVEEAYGTARFLVIYVLTSIAGFYVSMLWSPMSPSVGASAALFGLIGAMVALGTRSGTAVGRAMRAFYVRWAIYGLVLGFIISHVDNAAHVGGFVGGFALGYVVGTPRIMGRSEGLWKGLAVACIAVTVWAFVQAVIFMLKAGPQT